MQSLPLVSVDTMFAGPPTSTSTAKTGQDGIFSAHLAAVSSGLAATAPQTKSLSKQENKQESKDSSAGQTPVAGGDFTAPPTAALNPKETNTSIAGQSPAIGNDSGKDDATDDLTSAATLNSSAGAANAGIPLVYWTSLDVGFTPNQNIVKTQDSESTVSQMLKSITSAGNGLAEEASTKISPLQIKEAATASAQNETASQVFSTKTEQPLLAPNPAMTTPEITGMAAVPGASPSISKGNMPIDNAAPQPQITVTFVSDTAPATMAMGMTEQTAAAPSSVTIQAQAAVLQTAAASSVTAQSQATAAKPDDASSVTPQAQATAAQSDAASSVNPQAQAGAAQTNAQQNTTVPGVDQIVQNQYGQIITIHQANIPAELAASTGDGSIPLNTGTNNQNLDVNNNYIHSHLPNDTPKTLDKENNSQQQDTAKDNQQKGANTANTITNGQISLDQLSNHNPQFTVGTENQSLIFSHQQTSTPIVNNAPIADTTTLQLPSGLTVPGGTVVDQMIAHFSVNNRLESGTVNLRLTPQELGELRMEIKISQDNIKAHIIAQNPQAQEMISLHLPRLREALEQQGLHLQHVEVTIAGNDNASREQFQGHTGQQQLSQSMQNRGSQSLFALDTGGEIEEATQAVNNLSVLA